MEKLALRMQWEAKVHWRYKFPLNRKAKWHVQKLLARRQQQELESWLRHVENLSDIEEEQIHICEPETGRYLGDEEGRSEEGLINYQESRDGFSYYQVGNEMRSLEDILDCQEDSSGNSYC
jgi:hypothetical protein